MPKNAKQFERRFQERTVKALDKLRGYVALKSRVRASMGAPYMDRALRDLIEEARRIQAAECHSVVCKESEARAELYLHMEVGYKRLGLLHKALNAKACDAWGRMTALQAEAFGARDRVAAEEAVERNGLQKAWREQYYAVCKLVTRVPCVNWHPPPPFYPDVVFYVQLNGPLEPTVRLNAYLGGKTIAFLGMFVLFVLYGVADVVGAFDFSTGLSSSSVLYLFFSPSHCERSAGGLGAKWSSCLFGHWLVVATGWNRTQVHPLPRCAWQFFVPFCVLTFGYFKMFVFLCVEAMRQQEEAQFVYSIFNIERGTTNAKWQHWLFAVQANRPQHGRENVFGKMEDRMSMLNLSFWGR